MPSRSALPGTYFISTVTDQRRRIFQVERNAELLLKTLIHYRHNYALHAYVIMPDHLHLILTPENTVTLERCLQHIKGGFSHRLASNFPVWQKGFSDHRIRDAADYEKHLQYIHENPIRKRLCVSEEDYRFSSAHPQRIALDAPKESLRG